MGGQGGCERKSEVFLKIQKKKLGGGGVGGQEGGVGLGGGQGGCDRRIEVFWKIHKKKNWGVGGGGGGWVGGSGWCGGSGWMCERRIEVSVKI